MTVSRDCIRFGGTTIEYQVRRSARRKKTVQITVDGDGVQVAAPAATPDSELREIVRKRAPWILEHTKEAVLRAAPKPLVSGETLPYLGRNVRLIIEQSDTVRSPEVRFDHWQFRVTVPAAIPDSERYERLRRSIIEWYRAKAAVRLQASVDEWLPAFGSVIKPRLLIRDQRRIWGSCAADGTLRFNWRLMMLEPALIEYVVVHELGHLKVKNHSRNFWDLVAQVMPDVQQRRQRLREAGAALPL